MFRSLREWNLTFISGLSAADRTLPTSHLEFGEMTLWSIVEDMAAHDFASLVETQRTLWGPCTGEVMAGI
jgi:hypothetical protein